MMSQPLRRKRQRLENLPRSKTVSKMMDMIGRGQCSISAAAEIARNVVPRQCIAFCVGQGFDICFIYIFIYSCIYLSIYVFMFVLIY